MIFSICFDLTGILNHKLSPFKRCNISTVGLQKILSLLEAEDPDVRIHAVKVVANLAAEGTFLFLSQVVLILISISVPMPSVDTNGLTYVKSIA